MYACISSCLIKQVVGPRRLHLRHDPSVSLPQLRLHPRHELQKQTVCADFSSMDIKNVSRIG
jgi:hypothetical protein